MKVVRYKSNEGSIHGLLVKQTKKKVYIILMEAPKIKIRKLPIAELDYMQEIDYPVKKCQKHLRSAARAWRYKLGKETRIALRSNA